MVNDKDNVVISGVGDLFLLQSTRYHCPIYCLLKFIKPKQKTFKRKIWKFNQGNYEELRNAINQTDITCLEDPNINIYAKKVTDLITSLCNTFIPNKTVTVRPAEPNWITSDIKRRIRARKRAYKKAKLTGSQQHWVKFRKLRKETISLIRATKISYNNNLCNKLRNAPLSSKDWWKILKLSFKKPQNKTIPPLQSNNTYADIDIDKANLLNTFFKEQTVLNDQGRTPPDIPILTNSHLSSIVLTPQQVQSVLQKLPVGKASGPDGISNRVLRELSNVLSPLLCNLFNKSLSTCTVPDIWKEANVCAVFKKGDKSLVSNYRPISLLNNLEKVFERLIFNNIYSFIQGNNVLSPFQSGFRPGDSTVNQLTYLYNNYCSALDSGKEIRVVFF